MSQAQIDELLAAYKKAHKVELADEIDKKCKGDLKALLLAKLGKNGEFQNRYCWTVRAHAGSAPDKRDCKLVRILVGVVGPFGRTSCMRFPFFLRSKPPGITCMLKSEGFTPRRPLVGYSLSKSLDNSFEFSRVRPRLIQSGA